MDGWTIFFILIFGILALVPAIWATIGVFKDKQKHWPAVAGICWAVVLMIFFFIGMAVEWGGCDAKSSYKAVRCKAKDCNMPDPWGDKCDTRCAGVPKGSYCPRGEKPVFDFCEKFADGMIKQPWSTWSDLAFIAAGIWILWFFQFFKETSPPNPMCSIGWLSVTYGMIVIFMGPPSMLLHASMKEWGSWLDSMSVIIWLSFNAAYVFYLCFWASFEKGRKEATRTPGVLLPSAGLIILFGFLGWFVPESFLYGYIVTGALWIIFELYFFFRPLWDDSVKYQRTLWVFIINLCTLAATMTIWLFYNADVVSASFCQALESFPGHAFFHILASFATIFTFWSFATEKRIV